MWDDLYLLAGVSISRSHISFYLRTVGGEGRHMSRSVYRRVTISRLLIFQSLR